MDRRTEWELTKLGRQIPKDILKKIKGQKKPDEASQMMNEITLRNLKKVEDPFKKKQIEHYLENSASEQLWERDLRAETQAEKFIEAKIKKLIAQKKIPPPKSDSEMRGWFSKMGK